MRDYCDFVEKNERILDGWCADYVKKNQPLYPKCKNLGAYFARDGIMNKGEFAPCHNNDGTFFRWERKPCGEENKMWNETPLRVLYLTKDQNTDGCVAWDVRSESFRYPDEKYNPREMYLFSQNTFYRNLVYSLYGIMNTTPESQMDYNFTNQDALKCADDHIFARINCKKEVGEARCSNNLLEQAIQADSTFLKEQIINLNADVFVCCGYSETVKRSGNIMLNFLNTIGYTFKEEIDDWIYYDQDRNKIAINSYHLSFLSFDYDGMISAYYRFLQKHPKFLNSHRV